MNTIDLTIGNRELTVQFGWGPPCRSSRTDPGSPGGPEIEQVWEAGSVADVSEDEMDEIVAALERHAD